MPLIDERGRLFGRINLIDASAMLIVVLLVPMVYGAYRLFRRPAAEITSVEPSHLTQGDNLRLRVQGRNFIPYMHVQLGTTAAEAFLVESPIAAEVRLPRLEPGTYDFILFDAAREVARIRNAVTIAPISRKPADLVVRFIVPPDVPALVKPPVRDADAMLGNDPHAGATLVSLEKIEEVKGRVVLDVVGPDWPNSGADRYRVSEKYEIDQSMSMVTARLRVPAEQTAAGWRYKGQSIVVGAPFSFQGTFGIIHGWVLRVGFAPESGIDPAKTP